MRQIIHRFVFSFASAAVAFALCAPLAQGQTEKIIYSFAGGTDGSLPQGGLLIDASGNLYGITQTGGTEGGGTVYELSPGSGGSWTKTVLYSFTFVGGNVFLPTSNLVSDAKGNLYGMSFEGGPNVAGGIFELSPGTNGTWTEKVIYGFMGGIDVAPYQSGLAIDGAGNLYGYRAQATSTSGTISHGDF